MTGIVCARQLSSAASNTVRPLNGDGDRHEPKTKLTTGDEAEAEDEVEDEDEAGDDCCRGCGGCCCWAALFRGWTAENVVNVPVKRRSSFLPAWLSVKMRV